MNKVIFLVGPPSSGKDLILKQVFNNYTLNEFTLEQTRLALISNITEEDKKFSILKRESFIISTGAHDFESIKDIKEVLEEVSFETAMVFIDVSKEVCFERLSKRQHISEETIKTKFKLSKQNIHRFESLFDNFIEYDNNVIVENMELLNPIKEFIDTFLYKDLYQLFESKKKPKKRSLEKKLLNMLGLSADSLAQEFNIGNSRMGYSSTIGPMYNENFSSSDNGLPMDVNLDRTTPPEETLQKGTSNIIYKKIVGQAKKLAGKKFKEES